MRIIISETQHELDQAGADVVSQVIQANPAATLLVATGSTPMGIYRELAARRSRGAIETAYLRVAQLDEYLGLTPGDRRSLYGWMCRAFVEPLGIPARNIIRLPGDAPDPVAACHAYDEAVQAAGGIDLAILGLGPNGHLGFNEPPSSATAPTRVVALTEQSIESNGRYWGGREQVPRRAMTAGMTVLLAARRTVLVVAGAHKHTILRRTVCGPVTADVPASYLQTVPHVTLLADRDAWGADSPRAQAPR